MMNSGCRCLRREMVRHHEYFGNAKANMVVLPIIRSCWSSLLAYADESHQAASHTQLWLYQPFSSNTNQDPVFIPNSGANHVQLPAANAVFWSLIQSSQSQRSPELSVRELSGWWST
jgi:hypothetical protein